MLENDKNEEIKQDDNINDRDINAETTETESVQENVLKIEPAPEQIVKTGNATWKFLYPAVVLASISVIVALLLAVLNSFTADVIADRKIEEQNEAIRELFGDIMPPDNSLSADLEAPVNELLRITNTSSEFLGYCVSVSPKGFGGKINMLVAINPDGEIIKIKILDMSETAGIGTKVDTDYYLEQYAGKKQGVAANAGSDNSIDTISGATISSKAVLNGINAALDAVNSPGEELAGSTGEIDDKEADTEASESETEDSQIDTSEVGLNENSTEGDGGQE